ncbi:MAG TPA: hypothetical protein PK020_20240 [Ilumatobacteraceae bacterium]|nr:hypothetical protein [Ilumatobacteraceae bacterium]
MDPRFAQITALAVKQHSAISLTQVQQLGVSRALCSQWVRVGLLERAGPRSFVVAGSAPTWKRALATAQFDLDGVGAFAGRAGARLLGLDGFVADAVELLVERQFRKRPSPAVVRSTSLLIGRADIVRVEGLRVLRAERLILDSPRFAFSRAETENAIDSAIRLRLVSEQRLRTRVVAQHSRALNGGRQLLEAMVDTGGESRLERWFLGLVRRAGLPRPVLQKVFRAGSRTVARVDAIFPGGLVVEVAGHGTHATRRQRQSDAQRQTELTLRGLRWITFTYEDVRDRPAWVVARLVEALRMAV